VSHVALVIMVAQRFPVAKKLKKVWIAKQKTKSKWKAQKRREGIVTQRDALSSAPTLSGPHIAPQSSVSHQEQDAPVDEGESDQNGDDEESQNSSEDEPPLTKSGQKFHGQEDGSTSTGPSLREPQKQAYSRLHHYKSRPPHHTKGRTARHAADTRVLESSRKSDVGTGLRNPSRRGGQPDMRLRMSAMLEKIKREYS
jgi:hypothetical protein